MAKDDKQLGTGVSGRESEGEVGLKPHPTLPVSPIPKGLPVSGEVEESAMSSINPGTIDTAVRSLAAGKPEAMRTLLNAVSSQIAALAQGTGVQLLEPTSGGQPQTPGVQPPAQATLQVTGANGAYNLAITNPASTIASTIYHEVSYSAAANFASPTTLPVTPSTSLPVSLPGTTYYWRIRSSYDQVHFNAYSPAAGGNPAVSSGLQSSAATSNATVLNQTNYATVDSQANSMGSANVRVFGEAGPGFMYPAVKGSTESILPSATIVDVPLSSNQVVAYDGSAYQVQPTLPQVMADGLTPTGSVSVVGAGAVTLPVVVPIEVSGGILGFDVTNQGNGLTEDVSISVAGTGTGATAGAQTIAGGKLISVAPGNAGSGYGSGTTTTISGGVSGGSTGGGQSLGGQNGRLIFNDTTTR